MRGRRGAAAASQHCQTSAVLKSNNPRPLTGDVRVGRDVDHIRLHGRRDRLGRRRRQRVGQQQRQQPPGCRLQAGARHAAAAAAGQGGGGGSGGVDSCQQWLRAEGSRREQQAAGAAQVGWGRGGAWAELCSRARQEAAAAAVVKRGCRRALARLPRIPCATPKHRLGAKQRQRAVGGGDTRPLLARLGAAATASSGHIGESAHLGARALAVKRQTARWVASVSRALSGLVRAPQTPGRTDELV